MAFPSSFTLISLAQQKDAQIHNLKIIGQEDLIPLLKLKVEALLSQLPAAYAHEEQERQIEKAVAKAKDLAGQRAAYREEIYRIGKIIEREKTEKKRISKWEQRIDEDWGKP